MTNWQYTRHDMLINLLHVLHSILIPLISIFLGKLSY